MINRLQILGYPTVPETAIEIIQANPELRAIDQFAFQTLVVNKQIEREEAIQSNGKQFIFLDRSLIDSLAYCTLRHIPHPPGLDEACHATDYHAIFVLETLSNFDPRADTGRTSTAETSRQTYDLLLQAYKTYGYAVTHVPDWPVEKRIEFILSTLDVVIQRSF